MEDDGRGGGGGPYKTQFHSFFVHSPCIKIFVRNNPGGGKTNNPTGRNTADKHRLYPMSSHFSCHFRDEIVHNHLIEDPLLEFCPKSTTEDDKDSFEVEYEFGYDPSTVSCCLSLLPNNN